MTRLVSLVTGGAGFVGKHLVRALTARGEAVRVLDLSPAADVQSIEGSITDPAAAKRACDGATSVFHLAGNAQLWTRDPGVFERVNAHGTETMLEAARDAGVKRFVHCSSLTTYVSRRAPIGSSEADESLRLDETDMLGAYPRSKLLADRMVEAAAGDGFDAVIAAPTEPLGPGDDALTPPTQMILDFLNRKTPAYIDCVLNFTPVDSLADGLIAVRENGRAGEKYLLGGDNTPMDELLLLIETISGVKTPKTKLPYGVALAAGVVDTHLVSRITGKPPKAPLTGVRLAGRRVQFSSEKARRELGWTAGPLKPAMEKTIAWMRETGLANC